MIDFLKVDNNDEGKKHGHFFTKHLSYVDGPFLRNNLGPFIHVGPSPSILGPFFQLYIRPLDTVNIPSHLFLPKVENLVFRST